MWRDVAMAPKAVWFNFQICILEHAKAIKSGIPTIQLTTFSHLPWIDAVAFPPQAKNKWNKIQQNKNTKHKHYQIPKFQLICCRNKGGRKPCDWGLSSGGLQNILSNHFNAEKVTEKESWPTDRVTLPSVGFVFAMSFFFNDCASAVTDVLKGSLRAGQIENSFPKSSFSYNRIWYVFLKMFFF